MWASVGFLLVVLIIICLKLYSERRKLKEELNFLKQDIGEKEGLTKKLESKLFYDSLTKIYNREYFEHLMDIYNNEKDKSISIVVCDLDKLKITNDYYGHMMGDKLIKESAKILSDCADEEDIILTRYGGDEFVFFMEDTTLHRTNEFINKIRFALETFNKQENIFTIEMSIGYAFHHSSIGNMEELLNKADCNMYEDKKRKRLYA